MTTADSKNTRVLAVASFGGHWIQLIRMSAAWQDCDCRYLTTNPAVEKTGRDIRIVADASRTSVLRLGFQFLQVLAQMIAYRPDFVISTGASVGYFALLSAKLVGARTIWVDSIANSEQLSLSAVKSSKHADLLITQWPHLAEKCRDAGYQAKYYGKVF